jgi:two-component system, chemotaxis family, sensor kinase CheA
VDSSEYATLFLTESREHLSAINHRLLELERSSGGNVATDAVDEIFRAVHTIKGMSATMGYAEVAELSHEMESTLDLVRRRQLAIVGPITDLLFRAADALEGSIEAAVRGVAGPPEIPLLLRRLRGRRATPSGAHPVIIPSGSHRTVSGRQTAVGWAVALPEGSGMPIRIRLDPDAPLKAVRAFMIVKALRAMGEVEAVNPDESQFDVEGFTGELAIRIRTSASTRDVEAAVRNQGDVAAAVAGTAAARPRRPPTPKGVPAIRRESGTPGRGTAAVGGARRQQHVRIELRRLDALMNLIGELVITRGRLAQIARETGNKVLDETVAQASRLIADLQNEILQSRLVPVWQVFDRFPRVVRDTARAVGKDVEFLMEGKEIELDRSMLDEIGDPVVHLLRNAVDHGIEPPEERIAAGKSPSGRLVLSTVRERSAVEIRVSDDGRGIDARKVLNKAIERGLVEATRTELNSEELLRIISNPGFSTAERVTGISGRGVGMDVVFNRVRTLGGSVDVKTVPGEGTSVTLRLPLTLAIVRALLAKVGSESYAVPLTHVTETVELSPGAVRTIRGREVLLLRDDVLPVIRLRDVVELRGTGTHEGEQVVILETAARRAALIVDELTSQQEIVVKQFDTPRGARATFGGATILGDGRPALILDVSSLL